MGRLSDGGTVAMGMGAKVPDPIAPARRPACRGGLLY